MDRQAFLARVQEAARQGRAYRVAHEHIPPAAGYVGASGDICEFFAAEVNLVGGQAVVVTDAAAAREALVALLTKYAVRSALLWQHEVLTRLGIPALLTAEGISQHDYVSLGELEAAGHLSAGASERDTSPLRAAALAADIGITSVELAIAETGTLLMWSKPGQERMASLVPPVHVALVAASQIVPDLFDAFAMLQERGVENLPSNIALITGPSKTGDIELQLTTGVHGPKHWHAIVVREL